MISKKRGVQLNIRKVSKHFGSAPVLSGIELDLKSGEFVAIIGRSGCGKSTLLRVIAGLEKSTEGSIFLDGEEIDGIHPDTRVLFQDSRLLPWTRVLANVQIGVRSGDKVKANEALRLVGLEHRANDWPEVLSGGQKQRIALARGLAGEPRLLLLDEPLGALDALTRIEMQRLIERLWLEQGFSVILVTHDVSEAVALADRVVLLEDGKIAMDVPITLARPREKDSGFAYFEKLILDRVLAREQRTTAAGPEAKVYSYSI